MSVGIFATVFCLSAGAPTINVMALDQAGAQTVAAGERAAAECALGNRSGLIPPGICLLSNGWMVSV